MDELRQKPHGIEDDQPKADAGSQLSLWPAESYSDVVAEPPPPATRATDPPWSMTDLGAFLVFAALSFLLANFVAAAAFWGLREIFFPTASMEEVFRQTPFVVSMQTGWEILWFLFIYLTATRKYRRRFWEAIRWVRNSRREVPYLVAGVGLALAAQSVFWLFPSEKQLPIEKLFSSPESGYLLAVFGICVAPFAEELVFRGFFYPVFERVWGLGPAVLITALLFAFVHVPQLSGGWQEIAAIFLVGVVFSYCRGKTGSLLPPYLMHLAYNASLFALLYISTDRFRTLSGL